jgi:hypothetical protein
VEITKEQVWHAFLAENPCVLDWPPELSAVHEESIKTMAEALAEAGLLDEPFTFETLVKAWIVRLKNDLTIGFCQKFAEVIPAEIIAETEETREETARTLERFLKNNIKAAEMILKDPAGYLARRPARTEAVLICTILTMENLVRYRDGMLTIAGVLATQPSIVAEGVDL